ncbi:MAGUK p55 subfamily member 2 [Dissostichus eleginoides]|uniref:MAGUK p55 subfamily member 2 n=1 Tax=Dissostichus eleginoides TaxID=100907 RepID=A0AAD9B719_DISEL|nr:MAGUK p55 subfamily member 2 [Dissostichus eleginoides]
MPVASTRTEPGSQVLDAMSDTTTSSTTANDLDLIYLKGIMESPVVHTHTHTHTHNLRENNMELLQEILSELDPFKQNCNTAAELTHILTQPHFQVTHTHTTHPHSHSLLETHDSVAAQACDSPPPSPCDFVDHEEDEDDDDEDDNEGPTNNRHPHGRHPHGGDTQSGRRTPGSDVQSGGGELTIARILHGGMIDQQGLLHVGDVIKEVNGREVGQDARVLQEELQATSGSVVLKILPSYHEAIPPRKVFFKCHYDYDPAHDNLIPCKEAGLRFESGDILQIVNQDDVNWWQNHSEQMLEEKRKAFVKRDVELPPAGKKKKKVMYVTTKNAEFDRHEILLYEEVAKVPPFKRKTLVLIGAQGVGRRRLKNKMLLRDPLLFGTTIPYTSRKPKKEDKESRMFGSPAEQDGGRHKERALSWSTESTTGTCTASRWSPFTRWWRQGGSVCWMLTHRTSDFLPYVVFLQAPDFEVLKAMNQSAVEAEVVTKTLTDEELQRTCDESSKLQAAFEHYFDLSIVNDNLDETYRSVKAALQTVSKNPQWVPVTWLF